eukprot:2850456-Alexandrium_andersonii.AAC.1
MQPGDSVPTRMFRIAGLFREYGGSSLLLKPASAGLTCDGPERLRSTARRLSRQHSSPAATSRL